MHLHLQLFRHPMLTQSLLLQLLLQLRQKYSIGKQMVSFLYICDAGFTSVNLFFIILFLFVQILSPFSEKTSLILYVVFNTLSHRIILKIDCHIDDSLFMIVILIQSQYSN